MGRYGQKTGALPHGAGCVAFPHGWTRAPSSAVFPGVFLCVCRATHDVSVAALVYTLLRFIDFSRVPGARTFLAC